MKYSIENSFMKVAVDSKGAELKSILSTEGLEYLWQGDEAYWKGQSPNLFPYVGRLTGGQYTFLGETYGISNHGFARDVEFQMIEKEDQRIVFMIQETEETLKMWPFAFRFFIIYELEGNRLNVEFKVENKKDESMYFAVGGHPGFNVPLEGGEFEDYYLEFAEKKPAKRVEFAPSYLVSGNRFDIDLVDGTKIPLKHDLFDNDALVVADGSKVVTLKSDKSNRSVEVGFPDMKYLGFWHMPLTDAPYVCIEPWSTLPSREGILEELDKQPDMISLEGLGTYSNKWWVTIK